MTQRDLKMMVEKGLAIDATHEGVMLPEKSYRTLAITYGMYEMNGGRFQDCETAQLYAITSRSATLFVFAR